MAVISSSIHKTPRRDNNRNMVDILKEATFQKVMSHIYVKMIRKYRMMYLVVLSALVMLSFTIKMSIDTLPISLPYLYFRMFPENISCYYIDNEDVLETADHREFPSNSIFFLETSCKVGLDSRQACSVESAARAHPLWHINVLFTAPRTKESLKKSSALLELSNIKFFRIHLTKYTKGTPFESFIAEGALNGTMWRKQIAANLLKYLTLFKWGGVYLDLDVVVVRPLTGLAKNWAATESVAITEAAMAFSRDAVGRSMAMEALSYITINYLADIWSPNEPGVITRVLKKRCSSTNINRMTAATCKGFEVYGPELLYPIEWVRGKAYFEVGELPNTDAYVYHVRNHVTKHMRAVKGSPYETLAKNYCPIVYSVYSDDFG